MHPTHTRRFPNLAEATRIPVKNWIVQLDRDTWRELSDLSERLLETIGLVEPMLELANQADQFKRLQYLQAAWYLSGRGHRNLKLFARRWAELQERANSQHLNPEEAFADLIQSAQARLAEKDAGFLEVEKKGATLPILK